MHVNTLFIKKYAKHAFLPHLGLFYQLTNYICYYIILLYYFISKLSICYYIILLYYFISNSHNHSLLPAEKN